MNNTRTHHTIARRLRTFGAVATAAVSFAAAVPAAHADVSVSGNACTSFDYIDNSGSEACINKANASTSGVDLRIGAFDYGRDSFGAYSEARIFQYRNGAWILSRNWQKVSNSSGYGTTRLSDWFHITRLAGASHIRLELQSCIFDSRGVFRSCSGIKGTNKTWG